VLARRFFRNQSDEKGKKDRRRVYEGKETKKLGGSKTYGGKGGVPETGRGEGYRCWPRNRTLRSKARNADYFGELDQKKLLVREKRGNRKFGMLGGEEWGATRINQPKTWRQTGKQKATAQETSRPYQEKGKNGLSRPRGGGKQKDASGSSENYYLQFHRRLRSKATNKESRERIFGRGK